MNVIAICLMVSLFTIGGISQTLAEGPEALLGFSTDFDKKELTIEVSSSGCTTKGDFKIHYKDNVLTVIRIRRDDCKAMPRKIGLTYTLQAIGIGPHQSFSISNRFIVNENIAIMK
ncbi:MAG: hypothetical protein FJ106_03910 [Deltaproteobacteria bacterium]|nr:hypothetical protein [Deltaproteobacteria bacterium]